MKSDRRRKILEAAITLSNEMGFPYVTRQDVAATAGVADGLVGYYFGSMDHLIEEVVRTAIKDGQVGIVIQAIAMNHPLCETVGRALRARAASELKRNRINT